MKVLTKKVQANTNPDIKSTKDFYIREVLKNCIHLIDNHSEGVVFLKDTISVYSCPKPLLNAMRDFLNGSPRSYICCQHGISESDLDFFCHFLLDHIIKKDPDPDTQVNNHELIPFNSLQRLVFNVTSGCHLSCKYCQSPKKQHQLSSSLMNEKTAMATINHFFKIFDHLDTIQFSGAEPLLNYQLIRFICEEINTKHLKGQIKKTPTYTIVTSGTILSDDIIALLKQHQIKCTISMDGPQLIHDSLRGKDSFNKVLQFTDQLIKNNISYSFEAIYTPQHLQSKYTIVKLMDFFHDYFNQSEIHIPFVSIAANKPYSISHQIQKKLYREAIEYSLKNLRKNKPPYLSIVSQFMKVFVNRKPLSHYCPAGFDTFSVDPVGNVYPCSRFTDIPEFHFGNVLDESFPDNSKIKKIYDHLIKNDKSHHQLCRDCWASPFCSGCIGADFVRTDGTLNKSNCDIIKAGIEGFLTKALGFIDAMPEQIKLNNNVCYGK